MEGRELVHPQKGCRLGCLALLLLLVVGGLHSYAIWSCQYVPLIDYPNHMARHWLESVSLAGGELPPFYEIKWRLLANLGGDLTIPWLLRVFPLDIAGKIFLTLAGLLAWLGPAIFIYRESGNPRSALVACLLWLPFILSSQLFWGFLNFYSGLGLAFLVLANQVRLQRSDGWSMVDLVGQGFFIALLFLWHLAAWGIFGLLMGCHLLAEALAKYRQERPWMPSLGLLARAILPVLPSLILCGVYILNRPPEPEGSGLDWGSVFRKLRMPLLLFRTYHTWVDVVAGVLWLLAFVVAFHLRAPRESRRGWLLLGLGVLGAFYLALPFRMGTTSDADSRVLPAMLVCVLAWFGARPLRASRLALFLLAACLLLRYGSVVTAWHGLSDRLAGHAQSFAMMEKRSRVWQVIVVPEVTKDLPENHFLAYAVPEREIFLPTLFAYADQQPLVITEPYRQCVRHQFSTPFGEVIEVDEKAVRRCFDYLWIYNPHAKEVRLPASFEQIYSENALTVWRVR